MGAGPMRSMPGQAAPGGMPPMGCETMQGMASAPGRKPAMGCADHEAGDQPEMTRVDPMQIMNSPLCDLLGRMFHASSTDYFYED